ncbi:MAG: hypothetical protein FJZ63_06595, partial [Chlamydiae bacterium]|nr:hypothetical protein [Chlamydiota bacterium]
MKNYLRNLVATSLVLSCIMASATAEDQTKHSSNAEQQPIYRPSDVFLSSPDYTVGVYFTAQALQPSASNLHEIVIAYPLPAPTPNWYSQDVRPDYHFGFDVGINTMFHSVNTCLMLNWQHFHSSDSTTRTLPDADMLGPYFEIGPDASHYTEGTAHAHFLFNEANANYGVLVNFGSRAQANLFAGVSYAYIKEVLASSYSNSRQSISRTITSPSTFSGAGPQVGINFAYRIVDGFHLTGDASAALLVGPMKNHTTYTSTTPLLTGLGITPPNTQNTHVSNRTQVVPGLEGNIGFAYAYNYRKHYMISLEA